MNGRVRIRALMVVLLALLLPASTPVIDRHHAAASLHRVRSLEEAGRLDAAIAMLKSILQTAPENAAARAMLGRIYLKREDGVGAEKELRRALALAPEARGVVPLLARALLLQHEPGLALGLDAPPAMPPGELADLDAARAVAALRLGHHADAETFLAAAVERAPRSAWVRFAEALAAVHETDYARAVAVLEALVRDYPAEGLAWSLLGRSYAHVDQLERAEEAFTQAMHHRANDEEDRLHRGHVRLRLGKLAEAAEDAEHLLRGGHASLQAIYLAGKVSFLRGEVVQAERLLRRAYSSDVNQPDVLFLLARTYLALDRPEDAEPLAERAHARMPEAPFARKVLAEIYLRQGKGSNAEAVLRPYVETHPHDLAARKALINSVALQGRDDDVVALMRAALRKHPDDPELPGALARHHLSRGEPARAAAVLEDAAGQSQASLLLQAESYFRMGRLSDAKRMLERLTEQSQRANEAGERVRGSVD